MAAANWLTRHPSGPLDAPHGLTDLGEMPSWLTLVSLLILLTVAAFPQRLGAAGELDPSLVEHVAAPGEGEGDLAPFDAGAFAEGLLR